MNSESLLAEHAKKFISSKHEDRRIQGILFDGEGSAFATDRIQALKVSGLVPVGFPWIQDLKGKSLDEGTSHLLSLQQIFGKEMDLKATVNVKELLDAAKLLHSVQKEDLKGQKKEIRDLYKIGLSGEKGKLFLRYVGLDVSGSVEVGESDYFSKVFNCKRLIDCFAVFEKDFATVRVSVNQTLLRLEAEDVAVVLLPIAQEG